jgi:ABC-type uncharacterized transport system substrate-binding protein
LAQPSQLKVCNLSFSELSAWRSNTCVAIPETFAGSVFLSTKDVIIDRQEAESAARRLGIKLIAAEVRAPNELDQAFQALSSEDVQAVVVLVDAMLFQERKRIAALAATARLPAVYGFRDHVDAGGLISYRVNLPDNFRRMAIYVVKILNGARPSELPVDFPNKLELIINLNTANALGLDIPAALLARARARAPTFLRCTSPLSAPFGRPQACW